MKTPWRSTPIHFGKYKGRPLGSLARKALEWWVLNWFPNDDFCKVKPNNGSRAERERGAQMGCKDCILRRALDQVDDEMFQYRTTL